MKDNHPDTEPMQFKQDKPADQPQAVSGGAPHVLSAPIECLIAYHEKEAKNHVSSQWIYSNHMFAVQAYKKVLTMLAAHDQKVRDDATLAEHKSHVEFESELYATLVDPVAEGSIKEAEMRKQLLEQARWYRQRVYDLETERQKVRREVLQGRRRNEKARV